MSVFQLGVVVAGLGGLDVAGLHGSGGAGFVAVLGGLYVLGGVYWVVCVG